MSQDANPVLGLFVLLILLALYLIPTWIAFGRKHHQRFAILLVNLLLGWTFLGWVVALVWSATAKRPAVPAASKAPSSPRPTGGAGSARRSAPVGGITAAPAEKTCPQCAETVKAAAKICRFCNYEFEPKETPATVSTGNPDV